MTICLRNIVLKFELSENKQPKPHPPSPITSSSKKYNNNKFLKDEIKDGNGLVVFIRAGMSIQFD